MERRTGQKDIVDNRGGRTLDLRLRKPTRCMGPSTRTGGVGANPLRYAVIFRSVAKFEEGKTSRELHMNRKTPVFLNSSLAPPYPSSCMPHAETGTNSLRTSTPCTTRSAPLKTSHTPPVTVSKRRVRGGPPTHCRKGASPTHLPEPNSPLCTIKKHHTRHQQTRHAVQGCGMPKAAPPGCTWRSSHRGLLGPQHINWPIVCMLA